MGQGIFYLLASETPESAAQDVLVTACQIAAIHYQQHELIYIHCNDRSQAHLMDDLLWQFNAESFIPHNLKGEGPPIGAPIEIGYDTQGPQKLRPVLINLADQAPTFAVDFGHIFDFVASDKSMKALARQRYQQFRALGIRLVTQDLAVEPLTLV